jgi:hypothetical protein
MRMKKVTEITIETRQLTIIRRRSVVCEWCPGCAEMAPMVTPEQAAVLAELSVRAIYRHLEMGLFHSTERPEGRLIVCVNSVLKASARDADAPASGEAA